MRYSTQIKPIRFVEENASRLRDALEEAGDPVILTDKGEATAVLMSVQEYERTQDTLALLKIIAMAEKDIAAGRTMPIEEAFDGVRAKLRANHA